MCVAIAGVKNCGRGCRETLERLPARDTQPDYFHESSEFEVMSDQNEELDGAWPEAS